MFNKQNSNKILKLAKILAFISILVFFGSYLTYGISLPSAEDLPRQMMNGQDILHGHFDVITRNVYSYVEPDHTFANHHWLYGVFAYLLHSAVGWNGMVIFKVLFILLTFVLLFKVAKKQAGFWTVTLFSLPTMLILLGRSDLRPEMFSYFLIVVFIYLLLDFEENPNHKRIYWLIPLELLWVNTHLYFPVGLLIIGGFLVEQIILNFKKIKENPIIKKLSWVLLGSVASMFFNPYGLKGALFALHVNKDPNFPIASAELASLSSILKSDPRLYNIPASIFQYLLVLLAISFLAIFIFRFKKKQPLFARHFIFYLCASTGTGLLVFFIIRSLPLFAIIFLLAISANTEEMFVACHNWLKDKSPDIARFLGVLFIIILIALPIYLTVCARALLSPYNKFEIGLTTRAERSAIFFKENNLHGPIFNDTDIGSYLIGELYPSERVFSDNRFGDAYSASFFKDIYSPMLKDEGKWKEGMDKYHFNVIFFNQYDGGEDLRNFLYRRFYDPEWALVYADNYNLIYVRNIPENAEIINTFGIHTENLVQRLSYLTNSKDPDDHLAAADIYSLVGQISLAINQYLKFVSEVPTRGKVWMVLGRIELTRSDQENSNPYLAASFLERAIAEGWRTTESLSYLALAYYRTGQIDRTREMVRQELEIDPNNLDGAKWIGVLANEATKPKQ